VKASGLARDTKRLSETGRQTKEWYEERMRAFDVGREGKGEAGWRVYFVNPFLPWDKGGWHQVPVASWDPRQRMGVGIYFGRAKSL
jgi:hypothetical protein